MAVYRWCPLSYRPDERQIQLDKLPASFFLPSLMWRKLIIANTLQRVAPRFEPPPPFPHLGDSGFLVEAIQLSQTKEGKKLNHNQSE